MSYKFYKKREDKDWKVNDTFFREDTFYLGKKKIAPFTDSVYTYDKNNCHMYNRNNYHVKNVLVTDTHTWYKIVGTCQFDGKEYHSDSLLVNGTHSLPYCEDWESVGNINNPASSMPQTNSGEIVGKVPSFAFCPTCWASFNQNSTTNPTPANTSLYSVTLQFRNIPQTTPPQLDVESGWQGLNVVMNSDITAPVLTRKVLVTPAVRLYKGRGYRLSFRWADNRRISQSPWGSINQDLDSLYVMAVKGNQSGKIVDSFNKTKIIPGSLKKDLQSNYIETGTFRYRTYWIDYMPNDTGTYYFGIAVVAGPLNGAAYRFQMDYFCIDTLSVSTDCNDIPKFKDPLRLRISPDGKVWNPGDSIISPPGQQWCVGNTADIEIDFGFGPSDGWKYGWKMYWQKNTKRPPLLANWTSIDSFVIGSRNTNRITYPFTYKFQDYRLVLSNSCNTFFDTIGPFRVLPAGGDMPWRENFDLYPGSMPPCWDVYPSCRAGVKSGPTPNEFNQKAKSPQQYVDMDFITPASANCPMPTSQTVVPPGFGVTGGLTHRFSFWYKDNGISLPIDSIRAGWSYQRATDFAPNVLVNKINNQIVKNSKTNKWRYYTAEFIPPTDTTIHVKVSTYNNTGKRIYRTMFDDFMMKFKQNVDALVIAIDSPDYNCDLKSATNLKVSVMNIGNNNIIDMPVKVSVNNGTAVSAIVPGVTLPNEVRTIYVPNVDLSAPNIHNVRAWTDVVLEDDRYDDTFNTEIVHNELYAVPTDTIDSVCICSNYKFNDHSPNGMTRWYKSPTDFTPFYIGDVLQLDSLCKDTCLFRSRWNGAVCNTNPQNFSFGTPAYSAAAGGLTFDNVSQDTLLIDSVMVYANTLSNAPFNITITQFTGGNQVTRGVAPPYQVTKMGRQWIPIKIKIPPGTDYTIRYPGGSAALAHLPGFIYIGSGCPTLQFNITGDDGFPAAPLSFKYFFNMKIVKIGCESDKVKICFKTIPSPKFKIKDTNRVCSKPLYPICGPNQPSGSKYQYSWSTGVLDTMMCVGAKQTGWYRLTVTNEFGCSEEDSLNLTVDPSPNYSLGPDTSFCRYTPYIIKTGLSDSNNVVTWSDNQAGVNISILNPGTYISTAFNTANFCSSKDTIVITRNELPVFSLGNDRVFCGITANLQTGAPNLPALTYTWFGGAGLPIVNTLGKKKYWLEGVDSKGCKFVDTIEANLVGNPVVNLPDSIPVCGSTTNINGPIGPYTYSWSTTSTKRVLTVAAPDVYYLTVTDSIYGCKTVDSTKVTFYKVPTFDLGPDISKCADFHILNGPVGNGYKYTWQRPKGSTISTAGSIYTADKSGTYYLIVNNNDCYSYTDSVKITLKTLPTTAIDRLKDTFGCKEVSLVATSTTNYTSIQWGYPIDTFKQNAVQVKKSGSYSVSLTNECGTATKSVNVRVDSTPTANFIVKEYPDCMSVVFTNLSTYGVSYIWQFGDNTTSNEQNPLHVYTAEGDYLITLRTYNACGFAAKTLPIAKRIKNCNTSGIQSTTLAEAQVYVYPNPTRVSTQLIGVGLPNGIFKISISNLLGQTVAEINAKVVGNQIDESLDVSKFASGEYLVNISSDTESIVRKLQVIK
jgi:PKD domain/Secretion system C-terminal sorting domain